MYETELFEMECEVAMIVAKICRKNPEQIVPGEVLADLGIDSIRYLELMAELEERFGFEFEVEDMRPEWFHSVRTLSRFLRRRIGL